MPAPTNPPYSAGAVMQPRKLQRWLDINKVSALRRAETYFTIPAFTVNFFWNGYSNLIATFNYAATNNFSLKLNRSSLPSDPNYVACIAYRDTSGDIIRYRLWSNVGELFYFNVPQYTDQLILKNFRIEIWDTSPADPLVLLADAGSALVNGQYIGPTGITRWDRTPANTVYFEKIGAYWVVQDAFNEYYRMYALLVPALQQYPLGQWTIGPYLGVNPVPVTSVIGTALQSADLNIYTSVLQAFDYRYVSDVALVAPSEIITDLWVDLPANLPMLFPAESVPAIN